MASPEHDDGPLPAPTTTRPLTSTAARSRSRHSNASTSSSRHSSRAVSLVRNIEQIVPQLGEPGPSILPAGMSSLSSTQAVLAVAPGPSSSVVPDSASACVPGPSSSGANWSSGALVEDTRIKEEVSSEDPPVDIPTNKGKKRKAAEVAIEDAIYGDGAARRKRGMNGKGKEVASNPADDSAEEDDIGSPLSDVQVAVASDSELLESALPPTTSLSVVAPPEIKKAEPQYLHTYNCSVCLAPPRNATLIPCGHIFCGECLFTSVRIAMKNVTPYGNSTTMARCPLCRTHIPGWDGHGGGVIGLKPKTMTTISDLDL